MVEPPTAEQIAFLKKRLLKKGQEINATLSEMLAGKRPTMPALVGGKRGQTAEERLRGFLATIDERLRAVRGGTYGRCISCGTGLPFVELEQVPWIDTCPACAAAPVEEPPPF